jgi:hypothetical protein
VLAERYLLLFLRLLAILPKFVAFLLLSLLPRLQFQKNHPTLLLPAMLLAHVALKLLDKGLGLFLPYCDVL